MSDYENIDFQRFPAYREGFRKVMAQKSVAEIRGIRSALYKIKGMTETQIQLLIDDLTLMEQYKDKGHCWQEEFERMMNGPEAA